LLTGRGLSVRTAARHGADVAFDWNEAANIIGRVTGQPIRHVHIDRRA